MLFVWERRALLPGSSFSLHPRWQSRGKQVLLPVCQVQYKTLLALLTIDDSIEVDNRGSREAGALVSTRQGTFVYSCI